MNGIKLIFSELLFLEIIEAKRLIIEGLGGLVIISKDIGNNYVEIHILDPKNISSVKDYLFSENIKILREEKF